MLHQVGGGVYYINCCASVGGHIKKKGGSNWYIVPICIFHNNVRFDQEYMELRNPIFGCKIAAKWDDNNAPNVPVDPYEETIYVGSEKATSLVPNLGIPTPIE